MIRRMKASDNAHVVELVCEFAQNYFGEIGLHYDLDTVCGVITGLQNHEDASIWVVDVASGLHGIGAVALSPAVFNQHILVAHELIWYVQPLWRNSNWGIQLLGAMETWAVAHGAHILQASYTMKHPGVAKVYEAHQYTPMECSAIKVL